MYSVSLQLYSYQSTIIIIQYSWQKDSIDEKKKMKIHMNILNRDDNGDDMSIQKLKKYIAYCRSKCGPRLSESASEKLLNQYVVMHNRTSIYECEVGKKIVIRITVRQLEALVRIAESLAKMRLAPFANEADVDEALRLFHVSTLASADSGNLTGIEGFTTREDQEEIARIEKQVRQRFVVGSQISEHAIVQDFIRQNYSERAIYKVLHAMTVHVIRSYLSIEETIGGINHIFLPQQASLPAGIHRFMLEESIVMNSGKPGYLQFISINNGKLLYNVINNNKTFFEI
ncbi:unnamed protein product [Rotaria sordida]|uniref:DNA replication licensing factor MCM5 n=1 Tax=Rotaria sordida TaxID=392033 RepID=A0A819SL87_9BILA|nr:unnamed protein product [Rotaria sordida]CAF4064611.1 unnamed protein product [Rotaria sordida]